MFVSLAKTASHIHSYINRDSSLSVQIGVAHEVHDWQEESWNISNIILGEELNVCGVSDRNHLLTSHGNTMTLNKKPLSTFSDGSAVKKYACNAGDVGDLGWEDPPEEEMATHSSILAWETPWTEEPSGLQSIVLEGIRHDWETGRLSETERADWSTYTGIRKARKIIFVFTKIKF